MFIHSFDLFPGEALIYDTHISLYAVLMPLVLGFVFWGLALFAATPFGELLLGAIGTVLLLHAALRYYGTWLFVTNQRVIVRRGIFNIQTRDLMLYKIDGVQTYQDMIGRMLDFGDLRITASGGERPVIDSITRPARARQEILAAADRVRRSFLPQID